MKYLLSAFLATAFFTQNMAQSGTGPTGTTYRFYANSDSPVVVFIPQNLAFSAKTDMILHFHDKNTTVDEAEKNNRLIQQFAEAKRPAILILPETNGALGAKLSEDNGFRNFMVELLDSLAGKPNRVTEPGTIILSCHGESSQTVANIMAIGGVENAIKEAWVFDGLLGNLDKFEKFTKTPGRRFINLYSSTGETTGPTVEFDRIMHERGPTFYLLTEESKLQKSWPWMPAGRIFQFSVVLGRDEIMHKSNLFMRMVSATPMLK